MSFIGFKDFLIEVSKGNVAGHKIIHTRGRNDDIDTATDPEDVWAGGGLMNWPTSAAVVSVTSTSANDDGNPTTNTGAQTLTIEGLDANFDELSETITLNGTTAVVTGGTFIRINKVFVATTGTYHGSNEGDITGTIGGDSMFKILTGLGETELGRYTVPNGKKGYITHIQVEVDSSKSAVLTMLELPNADDVSQPFSGAMRVIVRFDAISGEGIYDPSGGIQLLNKTDVWFEATEVSSNDTAVDVEFEILVVDD